MRVFGGIFGMILLLAFLATSLSAMQMKMFVEERSPDGKMTGSHTIYADKDNGINVEFQDAEEHGGIIWNKKQKIAWMVDFIEGTYWAMTEADAAKVKKMSQDMAAQMNAQQQKMKELFEEQMKGMSEEEKNMMKKHTPLGMGTDEEEETVYEKVGSETVDQWGKPDIYVGRQYGETVEKVWAIDWDRVGVSEDHLRVFGDLEEFMGGFMGQDKGDQPFKFAQLEEQQGYPGFAVRRDTYNQYGEIESTEITKSVETQKTDPSKYQLPTDPELEETESPFEQMPSAMPPGF